MVMLSLVTGTLNRRESFNRLVKSIIERTTVPWELVVSDASEPEYPDLYPENVVMIRERPRMGCVRGYNRAFRRTRGKWVLWLNDDAEVMPGYAKAAIDFMESHPEVGIGALYYCEVTLPYMVNQYHNLPYANFGIINRLFGEKLSWFDENITMYGNDNSICFKSFLEGRPVVGIPNARIWHHRVMDEFKIENQKLREPDANALMQRYRHRIPEMQRVWNDYKHLQGEYILPY